MNPITSVRYAIHQVRARCCTHSRLGSYGTQTAPVQRQHRALETGVFCHDEVSREEGKEVGNETNRIGRRQDQRLVFRELGDVLRAKLDPGD